MLDIKRHSPSEIGQLFDIGISAVTKAVTGFAGKIGKDGKIYQEIRKIEKDLSLVSG